MAERRGLSKVLGGWLLFIALDATIQVVFKFAGATLDLSQGWLALLLHAAGTPIVVAGFCLYFCGFLVWMLLLKEIDLGRAFPMTGAVYVATFAAGVLLFHEPPNLVRALGVVVIIAGVVLLSSDQDSPPKTT